MLNYGTLTGMDGCDLIGVDIGVRFGPNFSTTSGSGRLNFTAMLLGLAGTSKLNSNWL